VLYGDVWPYFLLIAEGQVDAVKESGEGRSLLVTTFTPGEVFWGVACLPARLSHARDASKPDGL